MSFYNGFSGDQVSLNHIIKTLDAKLYNIPGVTSNENLTVTAMGESAYFYTRSAATAAASTETIGSPVTFTSKGVKRIDIPLVSAIHIAAVLPRVNFATVSADVVADKVIQETISAANVHNVKFIDALVAAATAKTSTKDDDAYEKIVDAIKDFKVANKDIAIKPNAVLVSSAFYAQLLKDQRFIRATALGDDILLNAIVGRVAGLAVIEVSELDGTLEFIILNKEGVAAPINVNSLEVVDATSIGYIGGTAIGGKHILVSHQMMLMV